MAGPMINPSTKFEDPTAICSWVMSSDISHRIPLTMRLQPLRMRRITWPMLIFYHHRYRWARFPVNRFKFGQFDSILGQLLAIFSPRAQKQLFMNIRVTLWHHRSIPWPRFLTEHDISAIWWRFRLILTLDKLNVRHISTSDLVDLLT